VDLLPANALSDGRRSADLCAGERLELTRLRGHGLLCDRVLLVGDGASLAESVLDAFWVVEAFDGVEQR
jgi:hypothetical protein